MTTENKVLEILKFIDISKATGIDKISGIFLKDDANILAKPIAEISNTSISSGRFPSDCKSAKLKPFYKKGPKPILKILHPFLSYHWHQRFLKESGTYPGLFW